MIVYTSAIIAIVFKETGYETKRLWTDLKNKENICQMSQTVTALKLVQNEVTEWLAGIEGISGLNPSVFARQERIRSLCFENNKLIRTLEKEGMDITGYEQKMEALQNVDTDSMDELGDIIDQGIVADHEEKLRIEAETLWDYPNHIMIAAANDAHKRAPMADAIVQTGAGFRMLQVVDTIEGQTGKPVVASDFALYWAMLKHMGLRAAPRHGHLLSTLS